MSTTHAEVSGRGAAGEPAAEFTVTGPLAAVVTLTAYGPLDEAAVAGLSTATDAALQRAADDTGCVVVDLTAVTYLAMEALQQLALLARACRLAGVQLRVLPSPVARRKIVLAGLAEFLPLER
ncbi:anti-sigma factor antagonist [Amycolatopsis sp. A133]|uniref:STAS domain-containing protein n=1 Tax=Amycolatopsis sp. A133 TaxID=3064472 RepID=UPI0027F84792|nr:STAS domain-containing protein [Amycolatopsis sp. A133]MDQ7807581.1 anti-sigma factor antagonist [Amycolatopsis sp. A133]